ncbi:4-hydroxy-3-methylbut-2-enyl diphosphate reductase [candidate division KSB1 bacterium]|nr:4-hydroxy-3-methylbut-2-enyl diphosphate reductase [candidate division KSB1 bacterium]RQW01108.1 MAG: 4-hydroxy-3-methylbut-2-enyl diphosphate reductase [candidate division KSB1 bacterium]
MKVIIDTHAGPCSGVKRALRMIEDELKQNNNVATLGPVIHNQVEIDRLNELGVVTLDQESVSQNNFNVERGKRMIIRAHGIAKNLRNQLVNAGFELIDGTCPTVLKIQKDIERYYRDGYQILIVGNPNHPEVKGLNGQCDNQAAILQSEDDIDHIRFSDKALLISQTTVAFNKFLAIQKKILQIAPHVIVKDTICRQVNSRHENIRNFAADVDVVLLVGGKNSSNTRVLFEIAKQSNPHTFWIERQEDIDGGWFAGCHCIGITGSASTPVWQLEHIKTYVESVTLN